MTSIQPGPDVDAVVVGAGFGGLYMLHQLRDEVGLSVQVFERADGMGGTWYWNRYPGAKSDTESYIYRYSFDSALLEEDHWDNSYITQPEVLDYVQRVVDHFDLARSIKLNTSVTAAHFDEQEDLWHVETDDGGSCTCRFLIMAVGLLSATNTPAIPGWERFAGELLHTGAWPRDTSIRNKRVGIIGTGSSGIQFIAASAPQVQHLTVFQRTPQYVVPSGKHPVTQEQRDRVKARYDEIKAQVRGSAVGFGFEESDVPTFSVSAEERERIFEDNWEMGNGFRFMFGTFNDIVTDQDANEAAASFIRKKIRETVDDPDTAEKLCPEDLFAKRPLCTENYYETFNRDNVALVDIKENPISEIVPEGVRTADGTLHELDVLVLATGFDAVDGSYRRMDLRGRGGRHINDHWQEGPTGYLGLAVHQFPNMFMILGPNGPFSNLLPALEVQVEWITKIVAHAKKEGATCVEAGGSAEHKWQEMCQEIVDATLFPKAHSWIFGGNIPDKKMAPMFFLGGLGAYGERINDEAAKGYPGFDIKIPAASAGRN